MTGRPRSRSTVVLVPTGLCAVLISACSATAPDQDDAAASSSVAAALSSAAQASPGAYGEPADPSVPNPTDVATDPATSSASRPGSSATVVVTYADWSSSTASVEVGAYVAGTVEQDGTCSLQLTGPAAAPSVEVAAEPDAGSTSCPDMVVPGAGLAPGTYSAVVTYSSPTTSGTSAPTSIEVP